MRIFKHIRYGIYMIWLWLQSFRYRYLYKHKGQEVAFEYAQEVFFRWSEFTVKTVGMKIEVKGIENIPKETCAFMGNHQSILDIPLLKCTCNRHIAFVAKKESLEYPFLGFWIKNTNCVPLDRENPRDAIKAINKASDFIKAGYNMVIFPEGTRSKTGEIDEFKKGSIKMATKAKAPIVPFSIDGTDKCFEKGKKFAEGKVTIVFGKPIYTEELSKEEEKVLAEKIREKVLENQIKV